MAQNPDYSTPLEQSVSAAVEVARRIRRKRPEELALTAGIGRASYFNRIAGRAAWRLREVEALAFALEMPTETLLGGPEAVLEFVVANETANERSSSVWSANEQVGAGIGAVAA